MVTPRQHYVQNAARPSRTVRLQHAARRLHPVWGQLRGRVLEIGCSSGEAMELMARRGIMVTGLDTGPELIEEARAHGLDAMQLHVDAELPFVSASFDTIFCSHVLEHVFSPFPFLRELRRVLRVGGTLVLVVPNSRNLRRAAFMRGHVSYYDADNLYYTLRAAGFRPSMIKSDLPAAGRLPRPLPLTPGNWASESQRAVLRWLPMLHVGMNLYAIASAALDAGPAGARDALGGIGADESVYASSP
jgi:SAM-dependent methyltransferase